MEWIKCSDKLPENDTECLVAFRCDPNFAYELATYYEEDKRFISWNNVKTNVTHWMPLPSPPNEGDELLQKILDKEWELKIDNKWPLPENPNE